MSLIIIAIIVFIIICLVHKSDIQKEPVSKETYENYNKAIIDIDNFREIK